MSSRESEHVFFSVNEQLIYPFWGSRWLSHHCDLIRPRRIEVVYFWRGSFTVCVSGGIDLVSWTNIIAALALCAVPTVVVSQAIPTATRRLDMQVGGYFSLANPGIASDQTIRYGHWSFKGGGGYATFDPSSHLGLELSASQIFGTEGVHERTYLIGPRIYTTMGRFTPYAKFLIGRGVFNFPNNMANKAFTVGSFGGGLDYRFSTSVYLRADYEFATWYGFGSKVTAFPGSLDPNTISIGAAYHFGGADPDCGCGR
jgi:opacity protein-like surface antigen